MSSLPRSSSLLLSILLAAACKPKQPQAPEGQASSGIASIDAGRRFTMVLFRDGHVRMVGNPFSYVDRRVWNVGFTQPVEQIATGSSHACALLASNDVQCFGRMNWGALGYGDAAPVFDIHESGTVDVGAPVQSIAAGHAQTCAIVEDGALRCWGSSQGGRLGYGVHRDIGDSEPPASAGDVPVGAKVEAISLGFAGIACAIVTGGSLRCWGQSIQGGLGYGNTEDIGDDETPASVGDVPLSGTVRHVGVGGSHVCALMESGGVRCWGFGGHGRLGYGNEQNIGDDETAQAAGEVDIGGKVAQLSVGGAHNCVLLETGAVRCWGLGLGGRLGYEGDANVGDDELPSAAGDVPLNGKVVQLSAGWDHTCVVMDSGALRCWGQDHMLAREQEIDLRAVTSAKLDRSAYLAEEIED